MIKIMLAGEMCMRKNRGKEDILLISLHLLTYHTLRVIVLLSRNINLRNDFAFFQRFLKIFSKFENFDLRERNESGAGNAFI